MELKHTVLRSLLFFSSRFNAASGRRLARQASMPSKSVLDQGQQRQQQEATSSQSTAAPPARRPIMRSATSAKDTILAWIQEQVNHYDVSGSGVACFY